MVSRSGATTRVTHGYNRDEVEIFPCVTRVVVPDLDTIVVKTELGVF